MSSGPIHENQMMMPVYGVSPTMHPQDFHQQQSQQNPHHSQNHLHRHQHQRLQQQQQRQVPMTMMMGVHQNNGPIVTTSATGGGRNQVHPQQQHPFPHHHHHAHHHQQQQYPMPMIVNGGYTVTHEEIMLMRQLKYQVEFYFSPKNLQNDTYLLNQLNAMDHVGAVSVETICSFPKIRDMVHHFYTTQYNIPPSSPPPMAPIHLLQAALRLEFDPTSTEKNIMLSDDGLWISPTTDPVGTTSAGTAAATASAGPVAVANTNEIEHTQEDPHKDSVDTKNQSSDVPTSVVGVGGSASSLTTISGISGNDVTGVDKQEGSTPTSGTSSKEGGGSSAPTVSTGFSTAGTSSAPSSPSSQASSVGVKTYPLPLKERNTVIVRDIPTEATLEDVVHAFSTVSIKPKSARPDVGNTWYVTFKSEEQAVLALSETNDRTIAGAPIRGRLKSEMVGGPPTSSTSTGPNPGTLERSNSVTSNSTSGPVIPPPIASLPPSLQEVAATEGTHSVTDNDDSLTDSTSSVRRSGFQVPLNPPVHLPNAHLQHMHNQFPMYPPPQLQHTGGMPSFPMSFPQQGYGYVAPPPMYGGAPHGFIPQNRVQYFQPHAGYHPGMQPQLMVHQPKPQQQRMTNTHNQIAHHRNQSHRQNNSHNPNRPRQSIQPRQQQQQQQRPRQPRTSTAARSVSSATDHSQLEGASQRTSLSTPPQHVYLKHNPSKEKSRETIDGSKRFPEQLRGSNKQPEPDQLGSRPPTGQKKKKKTDGTNKKHFNPPNHSQANTTNDSERDGDARSISSRNSRWSTNSSNSKKTSDKNKNRNQKGPSRAKLENGSVAKNEKGGKEKNRRRTLPTDTPPSSGDARKDAPASSKQKNEKSKSHKKPGGNGKKNKTSKSSTPVINASDFPALNGPTTVKTESSTKTNGTSGYAQALLKKPPTASLPNKTETPSSTDANATVTSDAA